MRAIHRNETEATSHSIHSTGYMSNKPRNLGICLARIIFSFLVVCCHFFSTGRGSWWIIPLRGVAVPVFFVLAFYLDEVASTQHGHTPRLGRRLQRLLLPFWFWGLALAPVYLCEVMRNRPLKTATWKLLEQTSLQLTLGHAYLPHLWFLFALALCTTGWLLVRRSRVASHRSILFLSIIFFGCLVLQYSGLNARLFGQFGRPFRFPLGRLAECIPFAVSGIVLERTGIVRRLRNTKFLVFHLLWIGILGLPLRFVNAIPIPDGFDYQGLSCIRSGTFLVLFFVLLPLDWFSNQVSKCIIAISRFSLGIYCIHLPVGAALLNILSAFDLQIDSFTLCLAIYTVSLLVCLLMVSLVPKTKPLVQ